MPPITRSSVFLSAWLWASVTLAAIMTTTIETEAWTTPTSTTILRGSAISSAISSSRGISSIATLSTTTTSSSSTCLFGKKKKKGGAGGGGGASAAKGAAKVQVKLLQHIAGTGQAGDVIMVNPVFFANKLRPQKLARVITDDEVREDMENKQTKAEELRKQAREIQELLQGGSSNSDGDTDNTEEQSPYVLVFKDNQTGPDGKKLFGGIGAKKLMESLRADCKEFDAFSKEFTKQVSILDIEEQEIVVDESSGEAAPESKYKDYSSSSSGQNGGTDNETKSTATTVKYSSLPKKDKLTIKTTGVFRLKVALTKDLFARVKVIVD